jgi:Na+/alanine symporter
MELELVWTLADIANAGIIYCNLPALLLLSPACGHIRKD